MHHDSKTMQELQAPLRANGRGQPLPMVRPSTSISISNQAHIHHRYPVSTGSSSGEAGMNDYAMVWNDKMQWYDIFTMADSKTQLNRLGSIHPDDIDVSDINDRIAHEWGHEHEC